MGSEVVTEVTPDIVIFDEFAVCQDVERWGGGPSKFLGA